MIRYDIETTLDSLLKEGHCVINRTYLYLLPALKLYGAELFHKLTTLSVLGVGINDTSFSNSSNELFLLINIKGKMKYSSYIDAPKSTMQFYGLLSWIKEQPYYKADYPYSSGLDKSYHILVLSHPVENAVSTFKKGRYSEIYNLDTVNKIFSKDSIEREVLLKTDTAKKKFAEYLNKEFNMAGSHAIQESSIMDAEYDTPINLNLETFRYGKNSKELSDWRRAYEKTEI